jgi:hypothetical protein
MKASKSLCHAAVALTLLMHAPAWSQGADAEKQSLEEVRNTVINLLEALVQKGVMTRDQAQAMVADAQAKATADATARAAKDAAESDAVRVTYVPETVRKQITEQVRADVLQEVTQDVMAQAKSDGWGVPGAMPPWIKNVRLYGDVRARSQGDLYASDNAQNFYVDLNAVNAAGGRGPAQLDALLNVSEDRNRLVGRLRAGARADLGNAFSLDFRLTSGDLRSPVSTNQTLGNYGNRWQVAVDTAALLWNPINERGDRELDVRFGRFGNPFVGVGEMLWDGDLSFEGVSATYAMDLFGNQTSRMERGLFLTVGAFPLQEVELSSDDKWLYGGQLGAEFTFGEQTRLRLAGGYFYYDNVTGQRNPFTGRQFDFTAPEFFQKGNTVFDILNDNDTSSERFALAGKYELANASVLLDLGFGETHVTVGGEYVKNLGWDSQDVFDRTGTLFDERNEGYEFAVTVGRPSISGLWQWRAFMSYRYLEADAVIDAFTDSDFHLGGTDAKGYQLGFDLGLSRGAWLRLRYLTANEIDSAPLGIDVWQLDLNGAF